MKDYGPCGHVYVYNGDLNLILNKINENPHLLCWTSANYYY